MTVIDIDGGKENSPLSEILYEMYSMDSIPFVINAFEKIIEFLDELYPGASNDEKIKMTQVLKLEILTKFCLYAESLAAIAITFTYSHDNVLKEKTGLFNQMTDYNINQVIDFYKKIKTRNVSYIAKFVGYPPLILQTKNTKNTLKISCDAVKNELIKIGTLYLELRSLYNGYKHGYRVFFGKDEKLNDAFAFIEKGKKQKALIIDNNKHKEILRAVRHSKRIIKMIFVNHKERVNHENGVLDVHLEIMRQPNTAPIKDAGIKIFYPPRGEIFRKEEIETKKVYSSFKKELEKSNFGKYVALDIDEKKILGIEDTVEEIIENISKIDSSGRKKILKIGSREKNYEMY